MDGDVQVIEGGLEGVALLNRNWCHVNDREGFESALPEVELGQLLPRIDEMLACCLHEVEAVVYIVEGCLVHQLVEVVRDHDLEILC